MEAEEGERGWWRKREGRREAVEGKGGREKVVRWHKLMTWR